MTQLPSLEHEPTKARILHAVERLLGATSFERMSVLAICKEAGVSSPTFYKHFKDKYHVAQWLFDCVTEVGLFQIGRTLTWEQGYYRHLVLLIEHRGVFQGFMAEASGYFSLPSYGRRRQREELHRTLVEYKRIKIDDELEFQINYFVQLETHSAIDWVKSGMQTPPARTYAQYLANVVPRRLFDLLNEPVSPMF